jgi:Na+-transporting NADH:ubiquinone oxidoreductase subunit NqrC
MKNESGSAMLVVLTLTILITTLVVTNSFVLSQLRTELKRIDHEQQKKFAPATAKN